MPNLLREMSLIERDRPTTFPELRGQPDGGIIDPLQHSKISVEHKFVRHVRDDKDLFKDISRPLSKLDVEPYFFDFVFDEDLGNKPPAVIPPRASSPCPLIHEVKVQDCLPGVLIWLQIPPSIQSYNLDAPEEPIQSLLFLFLSVEFKVDQRVILDLNMEISQQLTNVWLFNLWHNLDRYLPRFSCFTWRCEVSLE